MLASRPDSYADAAAVLTACREGALTKQLNQCSLLPLQLSMSCDPIVHAAAAAVQVVRLYCARCWCSCPCRARQCGSSGSGRWSRWTRCWRSCPPAMPKSRRRRRQRRRRRLSAATPKPALGAASKFACPSVVTVNPQGHTECTFRVCCAWRCLFQPHAEANVTWTTVMLHIVLQVGLQCAIASALNRWQRTSARRHASDCV